MCEGCMNGDDLVVRVFGDPGCEVLNAVPGGRWCLERDSSLRVPPVCQTGKNELYT